MPGNPSSRPPSEDRRSSKFIHHSFASCMCKYSVNSAFWLFVLCLRRPLGMCPRGRLAGMSQTPYPSAGVIIISHDPTCWGCNDVSFSAQHAHTGREMIIFRPVGNSLTTNMRMQFSHLILGLRCISLPLGRLDAALRQA